jgi:diguanylate cyclase
LREEILKGLARGEFFLVYQPQFTADGARVAAVEALVRWRHPQRGLIGPATFIEVAEEANVIDELGAFVLNQAMREAKAWRDISVSVNVSSHQLRRADFADEVVSAAAREGFPLARLELEIVENVAIASFEQTSATLQRLRALGVKIALDDFGTGYSSLTYLRKLPLDKLKIDKSFVDDVALVNSAAIVQATIALARALGLKVTAEGVETAEQQLFLRLSGAHFLQGYLFSKPVEAAEISRRLADWTPERRAG